MTYFELNINKNQILIKYEKGLTLGLNLFHIIKTS
jgi:hypothetical protein